MLGFEKAESLCLTMEIVTDMFSKVLANTVHDKIMTTSTIIFDPKNTPVDFLAGYVVNDQLNDIIGSSDTLSNCQQALEVVYGNLVQIFHVHMSNKLQHNTVKCTISRSTNKKFGQGKPWWSNELFSLCSNVSKAEKIRLNCDNHDKKYLKEI